MTKKTKKQMADFFEQKGQQSFPIHISPASSEILKHLDWTIAEWDEFSAWWIENCAFVVSSQVMGYLEIKGKKDLE